MTASSSPNSSQLASSQPGLAPTAGGLGSPSRSEEDGFNLGALLQVARRRWWIIALVGIGVTSYQWYQVLQQPPRYQSTAELLVEPIAGDEEVAALNESLSTFRSARLDYPTQIAVLRSSKVMRPIYTELSEDPALQRTVGGLSYGALVGRLRIARLGDTKILRLTYTDGDPNRAQAILERVAQGYIKYSAEEQQIGQREGLKLVERQLPTLYDRVNDIQLRLENFRQRHNIINPVTLGEQLTSSLTTLQRQQSDAQIALQETESRKTALEQQLGVSLSAAVTTVTLGESPRYQGFLNELQSVETEIALELTRFKASTPNIEVLEERRETLRSLLRQEADTILQDQPLGTAATDDAQVEGNLVAQNPLRLTLTEELVDVTNNIEALKVRQESLIFAENQVRNDLDEVAELARAYQNIEVELGVATGSLNRFLALRERLQLESVQNTLPWQILEEPAAGRQVSANLQRGLLLGALAGLGAAAAAAYLAEKIDTKLHSPETVKEFTRLPLLGVIPFQRGLGSRSTAEGAPGASASANGNGDADGDRYRSFPFQEAFRSLQANLAFANPDRPLRSIVVSSCIPKEGKSTISTHLAQAAAAMGQKVLLVDADMRRPHVHQIMELPNARGLSNVISTGVSLDEAAQQSPNENLTILTSGPTPPDPTRLLSSQVMAGLVRQWQEEFDLTIFDSPPMGGLADAKILSAHTSGLLMVVGMGVVDRPLLRDVLENLRLARSSLLGVVANSRKASGVNSSYYYNYYYRYYISQDSKANGKKQSLNGTSEGEGESLATTNGSDRDRPGG